MLKVYWFNILLTLYAKSLILGLTICGSGLCGQCEVVLKFFQALILVFNIPIVAKLLGV